uniref:Uncharacterized protein n=1 Tax=Setaria viridis TaxID=4556 RepID=A0A4U6TDQ6_SETVI|nr:hypothetical protein SEVIR_8G023000v2 [Setaria viridis]
MFPGPPWRAGARPRRHREALLGTHLGDQPLLKQHNPSSPVTTTRSNASVARLLHDCQREDCGLHKHRPSGNAASPRGQAASQSAGREHSADAKMKRPPRQPGVEHHCLAFKKG